MWKKIAANTFYQLVGKGFTIVSTVFTVALITRSLGVSQFGEYVLVTTVPTFLYLFGDFGLNAIFLRQIAQDNNHVRKFGNLFTLRTALAFVTFLLGVLYVFLFPHSQTVRLGILLALTTVFAQGVYTSLNALFQHELRYDLSVAAGVVSSVFAVLAVAYGFWQHQGLLFFVAVWTATTFLLALFALVFSLRLPEKPQFSWDWAWIKTFFVASIPLGLMLIFSQINWTSDVFLLSALSTSTAVGIYRLGYKVFENIIPIPIFFVNALYPVMLQDQRLSFEALWQRLKKSLGALLLSAVVLTVLSFVFAPLAISVLGGEGFEASTLVLKILVFSFPIFFVTAPLQWFLITVGKEKILVWIYGFAAFSNVLINLIFIPRFSYFASIFATIFSEVLILILLVWQVVVFKKRVTVQSK